MVNGTTYQRKPKKVGDKVKFEVTILPSGTTHTIEGTVLKCLSEWYYEIEYTQPKGTKEAGKTKIKRLTDSFLL